MSWTPQKEKPPDEGKNPPSSKAAQTKDQKADLVFVPKRADWVMIRKWKLATAFCTHRTPESELYH